MPHQQISSLPAVRKQHLLIEFSSLKDAAPPGVYMSLSPNDSRVWWGVLFVRKGPFKSGIFKFIIRFPEHYPAVLPSITFHTPIYHPLVQAHTPSSDNPGLFSLRHGFPQWFSGDRKLPASTSSQPLPHRPSFSFAQPVVNSPRRPGREVSTVEVLEYVKSTFDDGVVLESIPLNSAENVQAWKAWNLGEGRRGGTGGWDERVRVCVEASGGDGSLYGSGLGGKDGDEPIRFLDMDSDTVTMVKDHIQSSVESGDGL